VSRYGHRGSSWLWYIRHASFEMVKVIATFVHFIGYNYFTAPSNLLPPVPTSFAYHLITRSGVPRALPVGINEEMRVLFYDKG